MNNLLLQHRTDKITIASLDAVPDNLVLDEQLYRQRKNYLGDYDYLLGDDNTLIGISFIVDPNDEIHRSSFVKNSSNVRIEQGLILIFFKYSTSFHIETAQMMFTSTYVNEDGDYALVIPEFDRLSEITAYLCASPTL
jgi:hypothetical protein